MSRFFDPSESADGRLFAPAAERNRAAIAAALSDILSRRSPGLLLELASGTGEHGAHIAPGLPGWRWQPSDISDAHLASIAAWSAFTGAGLAPPLRLDAAASPWPVQHLQAPIDVIFAANLLHITPSAITGHVLRGAGAHLTAGGLLLLYGPFMQDGAHTAPSNAAFDAKLKASDARWGVRDITEIAATAKDYDLHHREARPMPANNFLMVFERL